MAINIQAARDAGYTDDEIRERLIARNPNAQKAFDAGYSIDDVSEKLNARESYKPEEPATPEKEPGIMGKIGGAISDVGVGITKGLGQGLYDLGRFESKVIGKLIPGKDVFEKNVQKEKDLIASGVTENIHTPKNKTQEISKGVGEFGSKVGTGILAASVAAPVVAAAGLTGLPAALTTGAVSNLPFIPEAFENKNGAIPLIPEKWQDSGIKKAGWDMVFNTLFDAGFFKLGKLISGNKSKAATEVMINAKNKLIADGVDAIEADKIVADAFQKAKSAPSPKDIKKSAIEDANKAAERAGIPLTRGQEAQPLIAPKPVGLGARVEGLAGSLPGGKGVMLKQQQKVAEAATEGLNRIKNLPGSDLTNQEALGEAVVGGLGRGLQKRSDKVEEAYNIIRRAGNEGNLQSPQIGKPGQKLIGADGISPDPAKIEIDSESLANNIREKVNARFPIFQEGGERIGKDIPSGLDKKIENELVSWMNQIGNINKAATKDKYTLFRNIKNKIGSKAYDRDLGFNEKDAYSIVYDQLKKTEREHMFNVGGEPLVSLLDEVNGYFAATKDIADFSGKLIGAGKDVGKAGAVDPAKALDRILKPKEWNKVQAVMTLMDEDAQKHLKAGLLMKIFDNSYKTDNVISLAKLKSNWKGKYGDKMLRGVLGDDVVGQVDDLITGLERARVQEIGMLDPLNPSGTAGSMAEKALMAAPLAGSVWSIFTKDPATAIATIVGAGAGSYGSRLAAKFMTKQALNPIEKEVLSAGAGALAGAGLGAATSEEGNRLQGALTGAGVGIGAQYGLRGLGKLSSRGAIDLSSGNKENLVVLHNLSSNKLKNVEKIGGLPAPSVAITDVESGMQSFGDISLIGNKSMVDPKLDKSAKVFGSDIYSPRYPSVTYNINNKNAKKYEEGFKLAKEKGFIPDWESTNAETVFDGLSDTRPEYWSSDRRIVGSFVAERFPNATKDQIYDIVENNKEEFTNYVDNIVNDVVANEKIFTGFTPSGSRKYKEHNLDNVVSIIKKELRGGESNSYGAPSIRAQVSKQYKSIPQIQKDRSKVISKDAFEKIKEKSNEEFESIMQDAISKYERESSFGTGDTFVNVVVDGIKNKSLDKDLKEYGFGSINKEKLYKWIDGLRDMPTEYFEGKIQRAVDVGEFNGAMVPKGTNQKTIDYLKNKNLDIVQYDKSIDGDYQKKLNQYTKDKNLLFGVNPMLPAAGLGATGALSVNPNEEQKEKTNKSKIKGMVETKNKTNGFKNLSDEDLKSLSKIKKRK